MPGLTSIYQLPVDTLLNEAAPIEIHNFEALSELLFPAMKAPSIVESASSTDTPASSTDLPPISSADVSTSGSDLPTIRPLQKRSQKHLSQLSSESTRLFQDLNQFQLNTERMQSLTAATLANIIYQVSLLEAYDKQDEENKKIPLPQLQRQQAMLIQLLPDLLVVANLMEDLGNSLASIAPKHRASFRIAHLQAYYDKLKFPQAVAFCVNYLRYINKQITAHGADIDEEISMSINNILNDSHRYLTITYFTTLTQELTKNYLVNYWYDEHQLSTDISSLLANRIRSFLLTEHNQEALDKLKTDLENVNKLLSRRSAPISDAFDIFFCGLLQSTEESFDKEPQLKTLQNFVEAMLKAYHPAFRTMGLYQPLDYALITLIHMRNISTKTLTFTYFSKGHMLDDLYFILAHRFNAPNFSSETKQILLLLCLLYSNHLPSQAGAIQKDKIIYSNKSESKSLTIFKLMDGFVSNYLLLNIMPNATKNDEVNQLKLILAIKQEAYSFFAANRALSKEIENITAQIDAATPGFFVQFLSGDETSHAKDQQPPKVDLNLIKSMIHQYISSLGASYGKRAHENVELYARHILQTMLKATLASIAKLADRSCLDAIGKGLNTHLAPGNATAFFEPLELSHQYIPVDTPSPVVSSSSDPSPSISTRLIVTRKPTKTASQSHGYLPAGSEVKIKTEKMLDEAWILRYQHFTDALGKSLSHLTIACGNEALLDSLLEKGHVHEFDREGNSLLHLAAYYNQHKLIRLICQYDPTLLNRLNERYQSPLHIACMNGLEENIRILIDMGAVWHLDDDLGHTPIHYLLETERGNEIWQSIYPDIAVVKDNIANARAQLPGHLDIIGTTTSQPSPLLPLPKAKFPSASMSSVVRTGASTSPIFIPESEAIKAQKQQIKAWENSFVQSLNNNRTEDSIRLIKAMITEYESIKHRDVYQKYYLPMLARVISLLSVNDEQFSEILWLAVLVNHPHAISLLVKHEGFANRQISHTGEEKPQAFIFWLLRDKAYFALLQTLLAQYNSHLLNCHDSMGLTPLQFAIQHSCDISYIQLLLGHVDINAYGFTPKSSAFSLLGEDTAFGFQSSRMTEQSFVNVSRSFPASSISIPESSISMRPAFFDMASPVIETSQVIAPSEQTPLSLAITKERWDVVQLLLEQKNIDITAKNTDGQTAIHVFLAISPKWIKDNPSKFMATLSKLWQEITSDCVSTLVDAKGNNLLHSLIICLASLRQEGVKEQAILSVTKKINSLSISEKALILLSQENHNNQTPYQLFEALGLIKDYAELAANLRVTHTSASRLSRGR